MGAVMGMLDYDPATDPPCYACGHHDDHIMPDEGCASCNEEATAGPCAAPDRLADEAAERRWER